jgi:hypothetical protein
VSAWELVGRLLSTRAGVRAEAAREVAAAEARGDYVTAMRIRLAQEAREAAWTARGGGVL